MSFVTFVARRHLKIKHQRKLVRLITILATLGVGVGVMVLVVVIAVMTGFQSELRKRILGIEAHITVMRYNEWIDTYRQDLERIGALPEVTAAAPFVFSQGMLRSADGVAGVVLRGIDPRRSALEVGIKGDETLNRLLDQEVDDALPTSIVIGTVLAEKLNVREGDELLLMVAGTQQLQPHVLPRTQRLSVAGRFETGMHQYDGSMGFVHLHELQALVGVGDTATGIEVRLHNAEDAEAVGRRILSLLGSAYWTANWQQTHRNLFSMLALQKVMMYVILTLIIVVAAFNIVTALIMMVKEKTKDIAILKAMGTDGRALRQIFLFKGMAIGLTGIGMGILGGLLLCMILVRYPFIDLPGDVYFLTTLPVSIAVLDLAIIAMGTFGICIFASYYPAARAARLNPVDGVRYG